MRNEGVYSREISPENSSRFSSASQQQPLLAGPAKAVNGGGLTVCANSHVSCVAVCPENAASLLLPLKHVEVAFMV